MKKYYNTFDELMQQLETIAKKQVKHYFTDFTDYDIPNLKKYNASTDRTEKRLTFIARECGTWLIFTDDIEKPGTFANTIFNYYRPGGVENKRNCPNKFYNIDLLALSIIEIKFDDKGNVIKENKSRKRRKAA